MRSAKDHIAIIEDDEGISLLLRMELESCGYQVTEFQSPSNIVHFLNQNKTDLILLDYRLGACTAIEVLSDLKNNNIDIPFIIMTGYGDQKLAVDMMKMGAMDYVIKDIHISHQICSIVKKALSHIETRIQLELSQRELVASEQRYRSIFENIQDVYFESGHDGTILEISPSVNELLNYERHQLIGNNLFRFVVKQNAEKKLRTVFESKSNLHEFELLLSRKNKTSIICSINSKFVEGKVIGTIRDISRRKDLEEKLLHAIINTEENERARFSQELHDGLGPVLASIKLYIDLLAKSQTEEQRNSAKVKSLDLLDDAVDSIRSIANNLTPYILKDFGLLEAVESFSQKISESNAIEIEVTYNAYKRLDDIAETTLYRAIQELIHNSLKHSEATKIQIDFRYKASSLIIGYSDNGRGFDLDKVMNSNRGGMGLRNIMSKMSSIRGELDFNTKPGKGFGALIIYNFQ